MQRLFKTGAFTAALAFALAVTACSRIDDTRLPSVPVNIVFTTEGMWTKYGISGALDTRRFIKNEKVPADFPYTLSTYTGFGGVLLVGDLYGNPMAYDLSCPFEAKPDIRVVVDNEILDAECPHCHSTYDIFGGQGRPTSGPAAERGYGLTRYKVIDGGSALNYKLIIR